MALLHAKPLYKGRVTAVGAWTDLYTVPSGDRVILRNLVGRAEGNSSNVDAYFRISGQQFVHLVLTPDGTAGNNYDLTEWLVMDQNDVLSVYQTGTNGLWVIASGSLYTI